jgi:hypothetical protein
MRVMAAIAIGLDCISIGIVIESITISSDCVSMSISSNQLQSAQIVYQWMLTVGLTVDSTWLCWAINLSKAFNSSYKRLLQLFAEGV